MKNTICSQCGAPCKADASFCAQCGTALPSQAAEPSGAAPANESPALWNPNAAANWSLIFSPAFGSYLQMLNWRALGQSDKAASAQNWFYASLAVLLVYVLMDALLAGSKSANGAAHALGCLYLLIWYFSVGRAQGRFVKEKFGTAYPKKPWGKALLLGLAAVLAYFVFALLVGLLVGLAG